MDFAAEIINTLHVALVLFIVCTPFVGDANLLMINFMIIPFIIFHWITNQSVCALTELEKWLREEKDDDSTFFGKLVGPVYKFKTKGDESLLLWTALGTLWVITFIKLHDTGFARVYSSS
jgi:hypothetical protein